MPELQTAQPREISAENLDTALKNLLGSAPRLQQCTRAKRNAPVAQLDRASDYESEGRGFESLRVYFSQIA